MIEYVGWTGIRRECLTKDIPTQIQVVEIYFNIWIHCSCQKPVFLWIFIPEIPDLNEKLLHRVLSFTTPLQRTWSYKIGFLWTNIKLDQPYARKARRYYLQYIRFVVAKIQTNRMLKRCISHQLIVQRSRLSLKELTVNCLKTEILV